MNFAELVSEAPRRLRDVVTSNPMRPFFHLRPGKLEVQKESISSSDSWSTASSSSMSTIIRPSTAPAAPTSWIEFTEPPKSTEPQSELFGESMVSPEKCRLGKQPLPRELDFQIYKEQVLDKYITEAALGEAEDDLSIGPFSVGKAKFNEVLSELLAIQFARTRLEGTSKRPDTASSSSLLGCISVDSAEGSGSKRNTQETVLTVPPENSSNGESSKTGAELGPTVDVEIPDVKDATEQEENMEESQTEKEPERPVSRTSVAITVEESDDEWDQDRPFVDGPIHTWLPAIHRRLTKRQKIQQALWKVRSAPRNASTSIKKAILGDEPWSNSPYFLVDEYNTSKSVGLVEKIKIGLEEPKDLTSKTGKLYARACEPYFKEPGTTKRECASCMDMFPILEVVTLDCSHRYCEPCLHMMVMTASKQESTMPPKCCTIPVRPKAIKRVLKTEDDRIAFSRKVIEFDTIVEKRTFCPRKRCGAFIPYHPQRDVDHPLVAVCQKCNCRACRICKGKAHKYGQDCPEDTDLTIVLELSKKNGWKRCYRCRTMVELNYGCNHMTCRCGAEFCYICGAEWSIELGCPIGCTPMDPEIYAQQIIDAEQEAEQNEAAAERQRLEQLERARQEEQVARTREDIKVQALLRSQKDEQQYFIQYSDGVIFKLKQRHYEEMMDLQLEQVGELLSQNSKLEERTIEHSEEAQLAELEFCRKIGLSPQEIKSSAYSEEYSTMSLKSRQKMLQMKGDWDDELAGLKFTQEKNIDKLRLRQDLEERVVFVELEERKTTFITEQRNALAKMVEFRRIATGEDLAPVELLYDTGDIKVDNLGLLGELPFKNADVE